MLISPLIKKGARGVYIYGLIHKAVLQNFEFSPRFPVHQPMAWWIQHVLAEVCRQPCIILF